MQFILLSPFLTRYGYMTPWLDLLSGPSLNWQIEYSEQVPQV